MWESGKAREGPEQYLYSYLPQLPVLLLVSLPLASSVIERFSWAEVAAIGCLRPFGVVANFKLEVVSGCMRSRIADDGFCSLTDYVRKDKTYLKCSVAKRMCCKSREFGLLSTS